MRIGVGVAIPRSDIEVSPSQVFTRSHSLTHVIQAPWPWPKAICQAGSSD